jgi:RimJ/RimL family protein N-acetyltransferase
MASMELKDDAVVLRAWRTGDETILVRYANNRRVWITLRDRFPHPYAAEHAVAWIRRCEAETQRPRHFAICVEGEPVGSVGLEPMDDVYRKTAEVGYWLAEPFWGRGLATRALRLLTAHAFSAFAFERLQACVFAPNPASCRVLEKCGYRREGRLRGSVFKDGQLLDSFLYARLRDDAAGPV